MNEAYDRYYRMWTLGCLRPTEHMQQHIIIITQTTIFILFIKLRNTY